MSKDFAATMRMLISAVGLAGTALFLQGCGDGGVATSCMAPHLDLVSQSISGTASVSMSGSMNRTLQPSNFSEKIDFEQFNLYTTSSSSTDFTNPITNETMEIRADVVQIMNLAERHVIQYTAVNDPLSGNITKTCMMMPLPVQLPNATVLSTMLRDMFSAAECGGNDGTYDTWKFSKSYDGPIPDGLLPVSTAGAVVDGSVNVEATVSQDSLLHSALLVAHVDVTANSSTLYSVDMTEEMAISSAVPGGPTDADLDPKQFDVDCTTPQGLDVNTLFTSSFPGIFQKHALATLQAALRPQNVLIAV